MLEYCIYFKNIYEFYQFFLLFFRANCPITPKLSYYPQIKMRPKGQNVLISSICILLLVSLHDFVENKFVRENCQFICLKFIFVEAEGKARYTVELFGKSIDTISAR